MAKLIYTTKDKGSPRNRPKVYFTCHPMDFDRSFDMISQDIFSTHDCAIFYSDNMSENFEDENIDIDLLKMQLFVIPVSFRLLCEPNFARDRDLEFAKKHKIAVLPIMLEIGIDQIYSREEYFGQRQYLNPYDQDLTSVKYKVKLKKYLDFILINQEMIDRIRKSFDMYIFLSYRKKDRRFANDLMRTIHSDPNFRDIAIWYDEFLTPGESFLDNIEHYLSNSKLFMLLVTPSLIEDNPNFVMTDEYPAAKKFKKPILPIEMQSTNRKELEYAYKGIPECIKSDKDLLLSLAAALKREAVTESDDTEHNFLLGLAYLDGIDVEIDKNRGLSLVKSSAKSDNPEAMLYLREMYTIGSSVTLNYPEAIKWAEMLWKYNIKTFGKKHPTTLIAMNNLAILYGDNGEYKKSLEMHKKCYEMKRSVLGEKNRDTIISINNLAQAYNAVGDISSALEVNKKCYDLMREVFGEDDPNTLTSLNNLSLAYEQIGDFQKAIMLSEKCVQIKRKKLGEKHPDTLLSIGNLSTMYCSYGEIKKAVDLMEKYYKYSCDIYGVDHPKSLNMLNIKATAFFRSGDYQTALDLCLKCYNSMCKVFGEKHPQSIAVLSTLSLCYREIGEIHKALEMSKKCYDRTCEILGKNHLTSLRYMNNLSVTYYYCGDYKKALEIDIECYGSLCRLCGEKHRDTLMVLGGLALLYSKLGDTKKALQLNQKCYLLKKEVLGEENPDTLQALNNLAKVYYDNGEKKQALDNFLKCYNISVREYGERSPLTLNFLCNLADSYRSAGDFKTALELQSKCYNLYCEVLGENNPNTLFSLNSLALVHGYLWNISEAIEYGKKCYELRCKVLGYGHPDTLISLNNLISIYQGFRYNKEAEALCRYVYKNRWIKYEFLLKNAAAVLSFQGYNYEADQLLLRLYQE